MAVISIRKLAATLEAAGRVSVVGDLYGFFRRQIPADPTGAAIRLSLRGHAAALAGPRFNINVIALGVDDFGDAEDMQVDYAIHRIRTIYATVGTALARVRHYSVSVADADGLDAPTTEDELEDITDRWTVPNDGIDLFVPFAMNVSADGGSLLGRSAVGGPCGDKDSKGMSGSVCGLWGSEQTGRTSAHELGHYLSLEHRNSQTKNLMCQTKFIGGDTRGAVLLTGGQGGDVKDHCMVHG